jgi:hypothetical protein
VKNTGCEVHHYAIFFMNHPPSFYVQISSLIHIGSYKVGWFPQPFVKGVPTKVLQEYKPLVYCFGKGTNYGFIFAHALLSHILIIEGFSSEFVWNHNRFRSLHLLNLKGIKVVTL